MIELQNKNDFKKVDEFKQNIDGSIGWTAGNTKGVIASGKTSIDRYGNEFDAWVELQTLIKSGEITLLPLTASEKTAQDETLKHEEKRQGEAVSGHTISLTEENQNGIASVLQGAELAAEMGAPFFPLNFNAMTAQGVKRISFADMATFKAFALEFLAARQKYFQ